MKRFQYKERLNYLLLFLLAFFFVSIFVLRLGIFGSRVDWLSQHSVFPDYFRRQFYETGELFPEFALNIGGGQNIYNFAYYGLYSPVVLLSYLLPFVEISDYMMAAQFLSLGVSVMLFYRWLRRRGFSVKLSFCAAVMFLLSGPMIYHSYNQIMFINYMPFLCMGFLGVDRYFDGMDEYAGVSGERSGRGRRRYGLLLLSIFLMVMTSFYFSIGGMLALVLYGIYRYFEVKGWTGGSAGVRAFIGEGLRFLVPFLLAVILNGVLLLPAAMALAGREGSRPDVSLMELLLPRIQLDEFFYAPYGIGLTSLGLTALIAMLFFHRLHERILAWGCMVILTVPVFSWLLNGGLYIRNKVMIPFLPLLCYLTACYLRDLETEKKERRMISFLPYLLTAAFVCAGREKGDVGKYWELVLLDSMVMLMCFLILQKRPFVKRNSFILLGPAIGFLALYGVSLHTGADYMVKHEFYKEVTDESIQELTREITEKESGFYRMEQLGSDEDNGANLNRIRDMGQYVSSVYSSSYNRDYQRFRKETFALEEPFRNFLMQSAVYNPVFQDFMGVKYLASKERLPGYRAVEKKGEWAVYENEDALPMAYVTDKVLEEAEYESLEFPYNQLALREYAVVKEAGVKAAAAGESSSTEPSWRLPENMVLSSAQEVSVEFPERIVSKKNEELKMDISSYHEPHKEDTEEEKGQRVLFLQFHVENLKPSKDVSVWVSGIRNKLTSIKHFYYNDNTEFTYAVPLEEGQTEVTVTLGKGEYELSGVRCFTGRLGGAKDALCQAEFQVDKKRTKGRVIAGGVKAEKPGYLITSIPYDKHFEIRVDGKAVEGEKVNTAFLGCRIGRGEHEIQIIYHAPGVRAGKVMSLAGLLFIGLCIYYGKKKLPI
ncbi:MAG: YfhO family protein [Lachnospiraceae bacterium]